jgi:hypothetical protein
VNSKDADIAEETRGFASAAERAATPDLKDPRVVLSLLEADQVVAAKQRTHFGRRRLSLPMQMLLWGLRVYVVVMLVLVLVSVMRAIHAVN